MEKGKNLFYNTNYEEQETNINIDYSNSKVYLYTSRKTTFERIQNKLGKPLNTYYVKNKIVGGKWEISFTDKKKLSSIFSRPLLIGNIK